MKLNDLFLTSAELNKLTGTKNPKQQVEFLRAQGLNPYVHPVTGVPVIYRDVVMQNQKGDDHESGFTMNLEALDA